MIPNTMVSETPSIVPKVKIKTCCKYCDIIITSAKGAYVLGFGLFCRFVFLSTGLLTICMIARFACHLSIG